MFVKVCKKPNVHVRPVTVDIFAYTTKNLISSLQSLLRDGLRLIFKTVAKNKLIFIKITIATGRANQKPTIK